MISIIVCSVDRDKLALLEASIAATIGVVYEVVVVDNRVDNHSLARAYNLGAQVAKYPYLCFVHEDITFDTHSWGGVIVDQLRMPTTGVIGFAGSVGKTREITGWNISECYSRMNFCERADGRSKLFVRNPLGAQFSEVITLDGLALMVRRDVWAEVRFDDVTFSGFHLYDLDFSTAVVAAGYRNYVCHSVMVTHYSRGSFSRVWYDWSVVYHRKWSDTLPLYVSALSDSVVGMNEKLAQRSITYMLLKRRILSADEVLVRIRRCYYNFPFHFRPISLYLHYLRVRSRLPKRP